MVKFNIAMATDYWECAQKYLLNLVAPKGGFRVPAVVLSSAFWGGFVNSLVMSLNRGNIAFTVTFIWSWIIKKVKDDNI